MAVRSLWPEEPAQTASPGERLTGVRRPQTPNCSQRHNIGVKGPQESERAHAVVKGPVKMKRPTVANFKHGGGQENFTHYPLLSHFQNNDDTVECSTLVLFDI